MRYHKSQCVRGLAKCSEMSLELPGGLVSKLELKKLAPELAKADSAHQLQLQRLAVECKERNGLCKALAAAKVAKAESSELASASKALYSSVATQLDGIISAAATLQALQSSPRSPNCFLCSICASMCAMWLPHVGLPHVAFRPPRHRRHASNSQGVCLGSQVSACGGKCLGIPR